MTTASLNYTGRKRIRRKEFDIVWKVSDSEVGLEVTMTDKLLKAIGSDQDIVMDITEKADHERIELERKPSQYVVPRRFASDSRPKFRVVVVERSGDSPGRIRYSSEEALLKPLSERDNADKNDVGSTGHAEKSVSFFSLQICNEIGSQLWNISADSGSVTVRINKRLMDYFNGDKNNPVLRAFFIPAMVREVFLRLFASGASLEELDPDALVWFTWAEEFAQEPVPNDRFIYDNEVSSDWLEWLDKVVDRLTDRRLFNGKTLLGALEEYTP